MIVSYDNHKEYAFLWIDESVGTHICFVTIKLAFRCGEIAVSHIDGDALFTDG